MLRQRRIVPIMKIIRGINTEEGFFWELKKQCAQAGSSPGHRRGVSGRLIADYSVATKSGRSAVETPFQLVLRGRVQPSILMETGVTQNRAPLARNKRHRRRTSAFRALSARFRMHVRLPERSPCKTALAALGLAMKSAFEERHLLVRSENETAVADGATQHHIGEFAHPCRHCDVSVMHVHLPWRRRRVRFSVFSPMDLISCRISNCSAFSPEQAMNLRQHSG